MARYACALILAAGLTGCATVREVPVPVPIEKKCPTLEEQISPALYSPVRELGRPEVSARGGLTRHLWLVFLEMEQELEYCNQRFELIRQEVESGSDENR